MKMKSIEQIYAPPAPHMVGDGFRVHNFFPGGRITDQQRMSPFFLLDYNALQMLTPSPRPRGVDVHPHRGFETVTIAFHGRIAHHDSAGNAGVIGEGDVQWMTAGSGVLHKEYHETDFSKTGGPFQMVQLWVNLPAKYKMTPPKYQEISAASMGVHNLPEGSGRVEVIAGAFEGVNGPAQTFTPIHMYRIQLEAGADVSFALPQSFNTCALVLEGSVQLHDGQKAGVDQLVLFQNDGEGISVTAASAAQLLVLSGAPLHEPIAAYGPFLMNTRAELELAVMDFRAGKFGELE